MSKPVIVCIDDEPQVLTLLARQVEHAFGGEYEVATAATGAEGVDRVKAALAAGGDVAAVIADFRLPDTEGAAVLAEVSRLAPQTRRILITGHATLESLGQAVNTAGLHGFVTKPWTMDQIQGSVGRALASYVHFKNLHSAAAALSAEAPTPERAQQAHRLLRHEGALLDMSLMTLEQFEERLHAIIEHTAMELQLDAVGYFGRASRDSDLFVNVMTLLRSTGVCETRARFHPNRHREYAEGLHSAGVLGLEEPPALSPPELVLGPERPVAALDAAVWSGGRLIGVLRCERQSGTPTWPPEDADFVRSACHIIATAVEASEQRRAERGRREAEERYRELCENAVIGIYQTTLDGRFLSCNPAMARMLGYASPRELITSVKDIGADLYAEPARRAKFLDLMERNGQVIDFETPVRHRDGRIIFITESARAVRNTEGRVTSFEGMAQDISDRVYAARELRLAKEAAEAANRAKDGFLAMVSHEIRTPMNGVIGMLDVLLRTTLNPEQASYIRTAHQSAESLLALINNILDFSKIESGRFELVETDFDLQPLLDEIRGLHATQARAKGLALDVATGPGVPARLRGDPIRLRQILNNLIGNAIKFTETGSVRATISVAEDGPAGLVLAGEVADTGIGIPELAQKRIFEPFEQAEPLAVRDASGTGLGLAICRRLAAAMGGGIRVASTPGAGSVFRFHVRLSKASGKRPSRILRPVSAPRYRSRRSLRILCADDSATAQFVARAQLQHLGHRVDIVANGQQAVEALSRQTYDAVFLDGRMPVMDGIAAAQAIRDPSSPALDHQAYLIAMTAQALTGDREKFLDAGFDDYVAKPVTSEALVAALAPVLERLDGDGVPPAPPPENPARQAALELWAVFADEARALAAEIEAAVAGGDCGRAGRAAHTLKGSAGSFSADRLAGIAGAMERDAAAGNLEALRSNLAGLRLEMAALDTQARPAG